MDSGSGTASTRSSETDSDGTECQACGKALPSNAAFCSKCGTKQYQSSCNPKRICCCCCCCCGITILIVGCAVAALLFFMNGWVKVAIETVGTAVLGVKVSLDSINIGLIEGRVSINDLKVTSPQGYDDRFMELGRFVFDLSPVSVLTGYFSGFMKPIVLEEVTLTNLGVIIDMSALTGGNSNVEAIVDHMNQVVGQTIAPVLPSTQPPSTEEVMDIGLKVMSAKVEADRIRMANISAAVSIAGWSPIEYTLNEILIEDVGKKHDGVYVYELIEILVRSLLMAVIQAAPENIRANLAMAFGQNLARELDYAALHFDMGQGLEKVGEFTGWAAKEVALLPVRMATTGAKLTGEALEVGTALTGFGIKANMAAAKLGMDASLKAAEAMAKLTQGFTSGFLR